jgi:hypothetical protein
LTIGGTLARHSLQSEKEPVDDATTESIGLSTADPPAAEAASQTGEKACALCAQ